MTPIFDALAHPTLSGDWLGRPGCAGFDSLARQLDEGGFVGACAIGLAGVEGYSHERYIESCRAHANLVPVAGFDPERDGSPAALRALRDLGFAGIKIHPRFSRLTRGVGRLAPALRAAGEAGLVVFYCTYMHCAPGEYPDTDPFYSLAGLLREAPATRVVLVHGGDVSLMRYAELVRFNPNLLLDLSLTLMKYEGSSIDMDLAFLFRSFDRRICVGTDWPEYSPLQVRARFEQFSAALAGEKKANIAWRNLVGFLGIGDRFAGKLPG
jgi:predicted TIM-barrel fold metal-dependent hydrolase